MAANITSLRARVEQVLSDGDHLVWTAGALEEAARLALAEYNLAAGEARALEGLDGAAATTLPEAHESMVVLGAAGYAAGMRGVERVEGFDPEEESPALLAWAQARLGEFRRMLALAFPAYAAEPGGGGEPSLAEQQRRSGLRSSTTPPWSAWTGACAGCAGGPSCGLGYCARS